MPTKKPTRKPVSGAKKATKGTLPKSARTKPQIRRQKIAQKVIEGKTEEQIAAELDMSRGGVRDAKAHPEFPATVMALLIPHQKRYEQGFQVYLDGMIELMQSMTEQTRLQAMDRFARLIELTQPKGAQVAVGITLEGLEAIVKGKTA